MSADGIWASGRGHSVENRHSDGDFRLLGSQTACSQPSSNQCLAPAHSHFDQCAFPIVDRYLPTKTPAFPDRLQRMIAAALAGSNRCEIRLLAAAESPHRYRRRTGKSSRRLAPHRRYRRPLPERFRRQSDQVGARPAVGHRPADR